MIMKILIQDEGPNPCIHAFSFEGVSVLYRSRCLRRLDAVVIHAFSSFPL